MSHSAIKQAIQFGDLENLKELVRKGASLTDNHDNGAYYLTYAVQDTYAVGENQTEIFDYLVSQGCQDLEDYCFHVACSINLIGVVKTCILNGANDLYTGLEIAVSQGNLEIVQLLVEAGVNISVDNYACMRKAEEEKHFRIVRYFVDSGAPIDLLNPGTVVFLNRFYKSRWTRLNHKTFSQITSSLFETFFLGLQRLEDRKEIPLAHQAMFEDMLECWSGQDDSDLVIVSRDGIIRI